MTAASILSGLLPRRVAAADFRPMKMVLSWSFTGEESSLVLAQEGGYFKREGVTVQVDRGYGSGDTIAKVASGAYEFGLADVSAAMQFNARQGGTKIIDVFQFGDSAPLAILSLAESKISVPADLQGKKIASPPGDSTRLMFPAFALANKIDPASISWLDVSPQLRETMLVQKQADAISAQVTHVPALRRLIRPGQSISVMKYSDFGLNLYGHAIITTPEFAEKNGDAIRAVLRACVAALKKSIEDPSASIEALFKRDQLVDKSLESERQKTNLENVILTKHVLANGLSAVDPARLQANARIVSQAFGFGEIDVSKLYRPEFLPPAEELRVPKAG